MSLTTEPSVQTYVRPRARDFGDLPLDTVELLDVMSGLTSLQLGVYMRLRASLWLRGSLPVGLKALAAIAQVTPRTFERMAPCLAPLFDHGADGRWHDHALEKKRGNRAVLEVEERAVDPGLSAKRSAAGKRGAEIKRSLRLVTADDDGAQVQTSPQANERLFASKTGKQNGDDFAATSGPAAARFAAPGPPSYGSIDRSFAGSSSKTDDRSIRAGAGAHEGQADETAIAEANGPANPGIDEQAKDPSKPAEPTGPPAPSRSLAEVDDAALIAALRAAGGDKIPAVLLNASDLTPLKILVAEGCELERDVVPAVANFARGCRGPLRTFGNGPIREKALASRDAAQRARAQQPATSLGVFVIEGTPPWRAWLRAKGVRSHFSFTKDDDRTKRGFYHPTLWPPGWDETRLAAAEAKL